MAKKIAIASKIGVSVKGVFEDFVVAQTAKGYTEKTIANYRSHFKSISRHIDIDRAFSNLTQADIDGMIVSMRESGLATNSISSYVRVFKTFMNWSRQQGYTTLTVPNYKQVETVKETYTDEELLLLLEKPKANGTFCEYRNWVIVNFLLNSGCRASTVRNIQNRDVDLSSSRIVFRHTKTHKVQVVPLCSQMLRIRPPEIELEKEIEIEKEREGETGHPVPAAYGRYNNVILTDTELSGLKTELPDKWEYYIDRLSCHIASTGKQYHSHAATIYKWAQEDAAKGKAAPKQGIPDYSCKEGESL